ncbi:hypothetical protein [Streptomyces sp. NPDC001282]|uniref:hypothetical protein n=1 Tax=Streptomyces sp. NPDC001282 TaxID=3364557 RepID=UPI00369D94BB
MTEQGTEVLTNSTYVVKIRVVAHENDALTLAEGFLEFPTREQALHSLRGHAAWPSQADVRRALATLLRTFANELDEQADAHVLDMQLEDDS